MALKFGWLGGVINLTGVCGRCRSPGSCSGERDRQVTCSPRRSLGYLTLVITLLLGTGAATAPGVLHGQDAAVGAAAWTVGAEPMAIYGSVEGVADGGFVHIAGVARGPSGMIAVADGQLLSISLFAADGALVATMGRRGEGPGEFGSIGSLVSDPEGHLVAFDDGHQRLSEWTFQGDFVRNTRLERQGSNRSIAQVGRFGDGRWYAKEVEQVVAVQVNSMVQDTVGFFELVDGVVGGVLTRVPAGITTQVELGGQIMGRGVLLSPHSLGVTWGRCLLVGTSDTPVLRVVDSRGGEVGEVDLMLEVEPATEDHRSEWVSQMLAMAGGMAGPQQRTMFETLAEATPMADRIPFGSHLLVDDLGYIWAQRYKLPRGAGSPEWRVFTQTGRVAGTVILPERFHAVEISATNILGVFTDELGRQDVRVYSLDRGGDSERRPIPAGCS